MNERERQYRRRMGSADGDIRVRYQQAADRQAANQKNSKMTYDEYLAQIKDADKIIEVDDDSRWTVFIDFVGQYTQWLGEKKDKYTPILKAKIKELAKRVYEKAPVLKRYALVGARTVDRKLIPLKRQFGAKNVYFTGITGIIVLVLLGGFMLFRSSGNGDTIADGNGEGGTVQGVDVTEPAKPNFEVKTPEKVSKETDVFFDPEYGVASYKDEINGNVITISQQPLSDEQKQNKEAFLSEVATSLFSETSFSTQFGTTHIASAPDDTGDQVAVFLTDELLIFIRTRGATLNPLEWIEYVNNIQN